MAKNLIIEKSDLLAHRVYEVTKDFPREEIYGITSQLRRASLSVPLNAVEGYARNSDKSHKQFLLISYGSLKETKYLLHFCLKEDLISENQYKELIFIAEEVGKLLWSAISRMKVKIEEC
jgi:four helix bundle protein